MRGLSVLCPQEYSPRMTVIKCDRCQWWMGRACGVTTGCEHLPIVPDDEVPECPIQDRCQHQIQAKRFCPVRRRGMVCESALATIMSESEAWDHRLSFNADVVATPEDLALQERAVTG